MMMTRKKMNAPAWLKSFSKTKSKRARSPQPSTHTLSSVSVEETFEQEEEGYMAKSLIPEPDIAITPTPFKKQIISKARPLKEIMNEALEEGLEKPLDNSNIGFKMLSKMGFREGSGLGKDESGRAVPLTISQSNRRLGLGIMEEKKRELEEAKKQISSLRESFIDIKKRSFETTKLLKDLEKAQKACEQLDISSGITESEFWSCPSHNEIGEHSNERAFRDAEGAVYVKRVVSETVAPSPPLDFDAATARFHSVVIYLRKQHHYCHYCSSKFPTDSALEAYCRTDEDCADLFLLD